jgi:hypothetical protein
LYIAQRLPALFKCVTAAHELTVRVSNLTRNE